MQIFKKILIILGLFIFFINSSFALQINHKITKIYNNFILKIEKKLSGDINKEVVFLTKLDTKLKYLKNSKKYRNNKKVQNLLEQFLYLNKQKIFSLKRKLILQKLKDNQINDNYKKEFESQELKNKRIIDNYSWTRYFKNKVYNKDLIFLDSGVWYTYIYDNYVYFEDNRNITYRDLKYNGIDPNTAIIFLRDNNKIGILTEYKKLRLVSDKVLDGVANKYYFLKIIKEDVSKMNFAKNYDKDFLELKKISQNLTKNLTKESKIYNIYNYILKKLSYSRVIDFNNYKIFSGIEAFKSGNGVCTAYTNLMTYMFLFSGINDVETIKGYVIDAEDFPKVGHAWIRIGKFYYDPTFDDPLGATKDREFKEYKYFALPKDLFYANRYDEQKLPEYIKKLSLKERKKIVTKNLVKLLDKYKNSNYRILKPLLFRKKYNIDYYSKIDIATFSHIIPLRVVNNFKFVENGKVKYITRIKYYEVTNDNIEDLLEQLDYDISGMYFFEWYDKYGNKSYKLAYEVEVR